MSSKMAKRQSIVSSKEKQVEVGNRERKGTEVEDEAEHDEIKEDCVCVTSQLCMKPIGNLDKEVVLRRIRHRRRVNKVRAVVGSILSSPFSTTNVTGTGAAGDDASVQGKRWVDDAFAAL